jgi:hypothetical protein
VNLVDEALETHRHPAPDPTAAYGWSFASVTRLDRDARVSPLAVPDARIAVADLLP